MHDRDRSCQEAGCCGDKNCITNDVFASMVKIRIIARQHNEIQNGSANKKSSLHVRPKSTEKLKLGAAAARASTHLPRPPTGVSTPTIQR